MATSIEWAANADGTPGAIVDGKKVPPPPRARRPETATELWCGACREMHLKAAFGRDRNSRNGLHHACTAVVSARNKTSHGKRREQNNARHRAKRIAHKSGSDAKLWTLKGLLADARLRSEKKGLQFDLTVSDLEPPERCPVLGLKLTYQAAGRRQPNSASIDRIDPKHGYTVDNVWIISWRANQVKNDGTASEHEAIARAMRRLLDGREHNERPPIHRIERAAA